MKKQVYKIIGAVLFLLGIILLFQSFSGITGFVAADNVSLSVFGILGTLLFVFGFILMMISEGNTRVELYKRRNQKGIDELFMTDPTLGLGRGREVSLDVFEGLVKKYSGDKELLEMVRQEYGSMLESYLGSDKEEMARKFLDVLYNGKYKSQETSEEAMTQKEMQEIISAFRSGWKNGPTPAQKQLMCKYGFAWEHSGAHGKLFSLSNPRLFRPTSISPSDINACRNVGRDLIDMIKQSRKRK
jgi:hypothetical protein